MKRRIITFIGLILLFSPILTNACVGPDGEYTYPPFSVFSINLLSPNDNAARNQFSKVIQDSLPDIGIDVDFHESTSWENIALRTWKYPLIDFDYIPTYAEGGYDLLFIDFSSDLDWDPRCRFTTGCMCSSQNFYQYVNPQFDSKLNQYFQEMNKTQRIEYSHELQQILYEDLPAISIVYPRPLFMYKEGLTGIDFQLTYLSKFRAENWDDPTDQIIVYALPEIMNGSNIFREKSDYDRKWMSSVYGPLFQRKQSSHEWEPVIALNYSLSSDMKNYTIYLDPNAKFSDGSSLLAEDVKYTYNLHMTPLVDSEEYSYLNQWFATNDSIEVIDSHSLNLNLTDPYAFSMNLLSFGILDKSTVETAISTYGYSIFNEEPLTGDVQDSLVKSCGPFMLGNYSNTEITLVQNPYWNELNASNGEQPKLDELSLYYCNYSYETFLASVDSGSIDIIDPGFGLIPPITFEFIPKLEGTFVESLECQEIAVNMKHPVFGTGELTPQGTAEAAKNVRKAISHTINRNLIVEQIYEGFAYPGVTPFPKGSIGFDGSLEWYDYNVTLGYEYMKEAGFDVLCGGNNTSTTSFAIPLIILNMTGLACLVFLNKRFKLKVNKK